MPIDAKEHYDQPIPPQQTPPPYQQQYPHTQYVPKKTHLVRNLIIGFSIIIALSVAGVVAFTFWLSGLSSDPESPFVVPTLPAEDQGSSEYEDGVVHDEVEWKSGVNWLTPPSSEVIGAFNDEYATAQQWLDAKLGQHVINVVITTNLDYNCGMNTAPSDQRYVAGCYEPDFGNTVFFWYGTESDPNIRESVLLHEYSHYTQNVDKYDTIFSVVDAGLWEEFRPAFERDATCRVYDEFGFDYYEQFDSRLTVPCGTEPWSASWLNDQAVNMGVTVTDH